MVACFLRGELASERFGAELRERLEASGESERLLTHPDLADERANRTRLALLASTRGYGENRELFEHFPAGVGWLWVRLSPEELERVRYIQYSYWEEISGGSRFPADAAKRIKEGVTAFGVRTTGSWMPLMMWHAVVVSRRSSWPGSGATTWCASRDIFG